VIKTKGLVGSLFIICLLLATSAFSAERDGSAETFLARNKGHWTSGRDKSGGVILFVFSTEGNYCGGESVDRLTETCGTYEVYKLGESRYLKLINRIGKVVRMTLDIKDEFTIILNGRQLRRMEK